jgi:hypothetical protein
VIVYVSGRSFLAEDVVYNELVGNGRWNPWTLDTNDEQVTYQAVPGRIMRYKFQFFRIRNATFSAFSDVVSLRIKAEK